uniref:C2H2-type domain-containing protein n=1 Tax=Glossina austeni TaxID=7395 RepID=A0A1A9VU18_GLOAU
MVKVHYSAIVATDGAPFGTPKGEDPSPSGEGYQHTSTSTHPIPPTTSFQCPFCDRAFTTKTGAGVHARGAHESNNNNSSDRQQKKSVHCTSSLTFHCRTYNFLKSRPRPVAMRSPNHRPVGVGGRTPRGRTDHPNVWGIPPDQRAGPTDGANQSRVIINVRDHHQLQRKVGSQTDGPPPYA